MNFLRLYLLSGLLVHKLVWEVLKRRYVRQSTERQVNRSAGHTIVKAVKIGILVGILVQTFVPELLPITQYPALLRIVGTALYTLGLVIAIWSRIQLAENWSDIEAAKILREHDVVSQGLYRYIRHPIYVGDLILLLGLELALNSWLVVAVVMMIPAVLLQAVREEKMLAHALPGYEVYRGRTKRFIPFVV